VAASAVRLLNQVKVKTRLAELAEQMASEKIAGIREIQEYLTTVIRGETTEDVVVNEFCGDGVSEAKVMKVRTASKDRIKAAETLGKMQGAFDSKLKVEVTVPVFGGEDALED
jgi:phage terminase small subunit